MTLTKFSLPRVVPYAPPELAAFAAKIDSVLQLLESSIQNLKVAEAESADNLSDTALIAGVPVTELVRNRFLGVFIQVFDDPMEDYWTFRTGDKTGITYPSNGTTGGKVFSTDKRVRFEFAENIPYDPRRVYRLRGRARYTALDGAGDKDWFRWGLVGFDNDGTTIVDHVGGTNPLLSHTVGADYQFTGTGTFENFEAYLTDVGVPGSNVPGSEINPSRMHSNINYFRPFFETNYKNGGGTIEIDFIAIDVLTVEAEIDALLTRNAPAEAGAQVFDGGDFALLTSRFFANLLRSVTNNTELSIIISQVDDVGDLVQTILLDDGVEKRVIAKGRQGGSHVDGDAVSFSPVFQDPPTVLFPPFHLTARNSFLAPFEHDFDLDIRLGMGSPSVDIVELIDEGNGFGFVKGNLEAPLITLAYQIDWNETNYVGSDTLHVIWEVDPDTGSYETVVEKTYTVSGSDWVLNEVLTAYVSDVTSAYKFRVRVTTVGFRSPNEWNLWIFMYGMHYYMEGETLVKIQAEDLTSSGFNLVAKLLQRNTEVEEIVDAFGEGIIDAEGETVELGSLSGDSGDDEYRTFYDVLMDIDSADDFDNKQSNLTGTLTAEGHTSGGGVVGDASDNKYDVSYSGNVKVTCSTSGSPVVDNFGGGIINFINEFKTATMSEDPIGNVTVKWDRDVEAICGDCGDLGSAQAKLILLISKDTGSGWQPVTSRTYGPVNAVAEGNGESEYDSGPDSVSIAGLKAGDSVRIKVTGWIQNDSGACCTAWSAGDPGTLEYDESGGSATNTINVKIQANESSSWNTKSSKNFEVTDTDGVENTTNISENIECTSSTATAFRVKLDSVNPTGQVESYSQLINPGNVQWKEGSPESATLTIIIAVDSKDDAEAWVERDTETYVLTDNSGSGADQKDMPGELMLFNDANIQDGDNIRLRAKSVVVNGNADSWSFSIDPVDVRFNQFSATPEEFSATPLSSDRINWVALAT